MKHYFKMILFLVSLIFSCQSGPDMSQWKAVPQGEFLKTQLKFPRVRNAFENKKEPLQKLLLENQMFSFEIDIFLRAFKQEEKLELWAKPKDEKKYRLLKIYDFCKNSGDLGPKRKEGDGQIPEGFYRISHYNPKSNFLLSLKINYPNSSDAILSDSVQPGDDIYIHGGCQTIGCIPITNEKIEEVYLLSVLAKEEVESIPVHVFPFKMTMKNMEENLKNFPQQKVFWNDLKQGYDFFEKEKTIPEVKVSPSGQYLLD